MKLAFYFGDQNGFDRILTIAIKWWTKSEYSHCEFVFQDGMCGSQQLQDGGVRLKHINLSPDRWEIIEIDADENLIRAKFEKELGKKYDILGNFGFVFGGFITNQKPGRWFCSEIMAHCLDIDRPELYYPGILRSAIKFKYGK